MNYVFHNEYIWNDHWNPYSLHTIRDSTQLMYVHSHYYLYSPRLLYHVKIYPILPDLTHFPPLHIIHIIYKCSCQMDRIGFDRAFY